MPKTASKPPPAPQTHAAVEDSLMTAGQREVNMKWETTQQGIALWVAIISLSVAALLAIRSTSAGEGSEAVQMGASVFLYGVANLVFGFYFGRTNHQKIGGVIPGDDGR